MEETLNINILNNYDKWIDENLIDEILHNKLIQLNRKIVVLDDDPTGVQTVHNISVYTNWSVSTFKNGLNDKRNMFFVLTNSRSFTEQKTIAVHKQIAENLSFASRKTGMDFLLISRSDSTLRGHYPLETCILANNIYKEYGKKYDGEIIIPFFKEGGRFTINNIHYVKDGDILIPAGMTEYARDKSFGYKESYLPKWCEEKTKGKFKAENTTCISLELLRNKDIDMITRKLLEVEDFNKIIVNAIDYIDIKVFCIAFIDAVLKGKEFIFRSAAAVTKVLGNIPFKPYLEKKDLISESNRNGGIILIGSHVNKTTMQFSDLKSSKIPLEFIEFNQHLAFSSEKLAEEVERVTKQAEEKISSGKTTVIFTKREFFNPPSTNDKDEQLKVAVQISNSITDIIAKLKARPNFIITKGGITSSDVTTKALKVIKAEVMGQIMPGIPVLMTGEESKYPNLPLVIFPGNVGETSTLREIVEMLI